MPDQMTDELLAKYFANETTPLENEFILKWRFQTPENEQYFSSAEKSWNSPDFLNSISGKHPTYPSFNAERAFEKVAFHIAAEEQRNQGRLKPLFYKVAASFLILGAVILLYNWNNPKSAQHEFIAKYGEKKKMELSDGSIVYLNSGSKLSYSDDFNGIDRSVELIGEAFFEVKRNIKKPFIVRAGNTTTQVLGTSFNVNAYEPSKQEVSVFSGLVQVKSGQDSVLIKPNEQAKLIEERLQVRNMDTHELIRWKNGILSFKEESLAEVVKRLERWYNVKIELGNDKLNSCHFTGTFENEKLMVVLEVLKNALALEYEINNNQIILKGRGCEIKK